ncbi:cell adhesion molecule 3 [Parasteatoda tepidariorum]|nr:cell adhesion molecule 3 [Parasteatoda tepidariorum]
MRGEFFIFLILPLSSVLCLKISSFEVPDLLVPGDSAYLTCLYDLGGEKLYSVKWYKNDQEFYRFFPSLNPQYMAFEAPGIYVDLSKSGRSTVYLRNVSLETEGRFTCQVSADEPFFGCVQVHRDISVYVPPEQSPEISGGFTDYGENLTLRCSSSKSRPAANLSWYINDVMMVPEGSVASHKIILHDDQLESASAQLDIPMDSSSLPDGVLRLACEASISNFVTSISKELLISREHNDQPQHHKTFDPQESIQSCSFMIFKFFYCKTFTLLMWFMLCWEL